MSENRKPSSEPLTGAGDPVALGLAMSRVSAVLDDELTAYLHDQRHHLHEQLRQIHLDIWEKWLGLFLRLATAVVGVAVAGAVVFLVLGAAHSNGLRVEPFSVPPDLAARGLTGEVVAARVIDRLSLLQSQTNTSRPARSYSNTWGDHAIKLEIPETSISLAELDNWLRAKLGNETHITGEIVHSGAAMTVTARVGDEGVETVSGPDADIDALVARSAEAIYRITQPYRYAIYLMRHENRPADALPIFRRLALTGGPQERRWSYNMWASAAESATGDRDLGLRMYQQAHAADPDANQPLPTMAGDLTSFGRYEEALQVHKMHLAIGNAASLPTARAEAQSDIARTTGDYHDALPVDAGALRTGLPGIPRQILRFSLFTDQLGTHDLAAARATLADFPPVIEARNAALLIAIDAGNWREALTHQGDMAAYLKTRPRDRHFVLVNFTAPLALAQAQLGDFNAAERNIAPVPPDCYPCLITRARIAELGSQHARADSWFARAEAAGPSLPFAFAEEGKALLARNKPDDAIARFTIANQKGPHFADALEGWGEALMAKNQSHLALRKFEGAEKYAPNWGRLHLKWGEALAYAGKPAEARAQFARAATLDLTPSEKAELARMIHV